MRADSMLAGAVHTVLGIIPTDPGYSYFRPNMRLFDPGWHGLQVKGEEDENTGDNGNDPLGVLARSEQLLALLLTMTACLKEDRVTYG